MSAVMNIDVVSAMVARALKEARIVSDDLQRKVVPAWPPHQRTFPAHLARRLSGGEVFDKALARDLETFFEIMTARVTDGKDVGWVADEHDTRGGSEVHSMDTETATLALCASNLRALLATIQEARDGARAIRIAEELLDT